jgi:uncharacterized tellurite resistance protein B-like protein
MEGILVLIFIFFGGWILRTLISGTKAGFNSMMTGESFSESYKNERYRDTLGPLEISNSFRNETVKLENGRSLNMPMQTVNLRGFINESGKTQDGLLVFSLLDVTEKDSDGKITAKPVLSSMSEVMEKNSSAFQVACPTGKINDRVGYSSWVEVFRFSPDFIMTPKSGRRTLRLIVRAIPNTDEQLNRIDLGFHSEDINLIAYASKDIQITLSEKGYEEIEDDVYKIRLYFVKFAVLIAYSDGSFDTDEGNFIKKWISNELNKIRDEDKRSEFKKEMNKAFKDSFSLAKDGLLNLESLIEDYNSVATKNTSISLIEFLTDLVNVDSKIEQNELKILNKIATEIGVSIENIQNIKDKAILENASQGLIEDISLEELFGITDNMKKDEVLTKLNSEFRKWNGRIQSLTDESEKSKAQDMLNKISALIDKYDK